MLLALPYAKLRDDQDATTLGGYRITQYFDENPQVYRKFGLPAHEGVDMALPTSTPLVAVHAGIVSKADNNPAGAYGKEVRLVWEAEGEQWETIQAHCSQVIVQEGQSVQAGDLLALSGNTGHSTGAHLHFSLLKHGSRTPSRHGGVFYHFVDPLPYLRQGEVITPTYTGSPYRVQIREGVRVRRKAERSPDNIITTLPYTSIVWLVPDDSISNDGYLWRKVSPGQRQMRVDIGGAWVAEMPTTERPRYLVKI